MTKARWEEIKEELWYWIDAANTAELIAEIEQSIAFTEEPDHD